MDNDQLNEKITEVSKTIFSFCMARTPCREDAEDLSQDILYELLKSAKNIRDDNAFYGFMWAVANNVYKQWCRKKVKNTLCELSESLPYEEDFEAYNKNTDLYLLRRELTLLAEKYRRATILYYIEHKSCPEISQLLSISESMVKYLLFKSRKILKEGMNMERKLGTHSYNPKSLIAMYSGTGPNRFYDFMQSKIRQNILSACYNDTLTPTQISLETGIPLPYLDDEINALEEKELLKKDGPRYKTNIIIITSECENEFQRNALRYHEIIADTIRVFLLQRLAEYKQIGFVGSDFSENTLRWQLAVLVFRNILFFDREAAKPRVPQTAWGDNAYLYCLEKERSAMQPIFAYSGMDSKNGDALYFFDYLPSGKGDHHDFYGNERYINILCDIAKGNTSKFSEYDLEAVAEMVRMGYVIKTDNTYKLTIPVYTAEQYEAAQAIAKKFVQEELGEIIRSLDESAAKILSDHTPKHLQEQVAGIASMDKFFNAVSMPGKMMVEKGYLQTAWHPLEMPTTYLVLQS